MFLPVPVPSECLIRKKKQTGGKYRYEMRHTMLIIIPTASSFVLLNKAAADPRTIGWFAYILWAQSQGLGWKHIARKKHFKFFFQMHISMDQANVAKVFFSTIYYQKCSNLLTDKQFSGNMIQIIDWRPFWGWRPIWKILDPPLQLRVKDM